MSNVKFEECFLKTGENFLSVDDLQLVHNKRDGDYERYYLGNFYCPECLRAQLSFHPNAQTPHFRSNGQHEEGCSFNFAPASKKQIEEYCNNQENHDVINRKLKSCLELLNRYNQKSKIVEATHCNQELQENPDYFTIKVNSTRRSIRRKKLTVPFTEDDYNIPMIFYGTVLLEWDLKNDKVKFIRIRNSNTNSYICSVSVSNNIYSYIEDCMKFEGKLVGDVAFLSCMEKKNSFNNCKIKYSSELVIIL